MLSKNSRLRATLNNVEGDAPIEWEDIAIQADFQEDLIEPSINIESFTFVNKQAEQIRDWIAQGRMFEGIPFKLDTYNADTSYNAFNGYVNCTNGLEELDNTTVKANIQLANNIQSVKDRMSGITMSYLRSKNVFTDSDYTKVKYVVEKSDNALEIVLNSIIIYSLYVELESQIQKIADNIGKQVDANTPIVVVGTGVSTGPNVGQIIYAALSLVLQVIYTAAVLVAIIDLGLKVFEALLPIPRTHRTLNLRTGLTKIANYLGYNFVSSIELLDNLVYLPSNLQTDEFSLTTGFIKIAKGTKYGTPNEQDFGFTALEFFELCEKMFYAQMKVVGNTLEFRSLNDPFWEQTATYQMPDVLRESKRYNANELIFSRLLRFETDEIADEWTINNFKGTNYEIITDDPTITNKAARYISRHETVAFPVALGNRKDALNGLEHILASLAGLVDGVVNFFGGGLNLSGRIKSRIGILKVGTNNHTKPKILYVNGTKLPANHRELFSAKRLYDLYLNEKSFVLNNFGNQKALYSLNDFPFGFEDFLKTIENSNFTDVNGDRAKFRNNSWLLAGDRANAEIEVREIYAPNLVETYIEAE